MWELYNALIDEIPREIRITECIVGYMWTMVRTENAFGVAMTVKSNARPSLSQGEIPGTSLKETATLMKSWNFIDASIGVAAANAYFNTESKLRLLNAYGLDKKDNSLKDRKKADAFITLSDEIIGKKVAVIGHFPNIEKQFGNLCELSILERNPAQMDYPDSACDYILPQQDYVFITGMTLINKTLEHLLKIIPVKTKVVLIGPSVPMSPLLFNYNIDFLSGFYVTETEEAKVTLCRGSNRELFYTGRMVSVNALA